MQRSQIMLNMSILNLFLALFFSPLLMGIINRTKAFFAGRKGQPLLQLYYDIYKLLNKGIVYSSTTTWIFRIAPILGLSAIFTSMLFISNGGSYALLSFNGDLILFAYMLGLMRFFLVISALDTGSSFEGMGASREVQFAVLAEPALFLGLAVLVRETKSISISGIYSTISFDTWHYAGPVMALVAATFLIVLLTENARVPVDDPSTHLELTMIHEVMVLDNSGPDFAFILYGSALKLWILGSFFIGIVFPIYSGNPILNEIFFLIGMALLAIIVGIIESTLARFRLLKVPQLLITAIAFSILALILQMR